MKRASDRLCELYDSLSLDDAISYFEEYSFPECASREIRTIGTEWEKLYDGGIERVLACLLEIWVKMGYRVVLFTTEPSNERDYKYPSEVKRIDIPDFNNMSERMRVLEEHIVEEKIDIWIANSWSFNNLIWDLALVKSQGIPFLNYHHGHFSWMFRGFIDYGLRCTRVFRMCDALLSLSDNDAEFYRLNGCRVIRIENPIQKELKGIDESSTCRSNRILWIGRFASGKRFEDAILVAEKLKSRHKSFVMDVVATGPLEKHFRHLVKAKKLNDVIFFHGYQEDVEPFYRNAGMMLMTSETESYSLTLLESKAYGIPTVMYELPYLSMVKEHKGICTSKLRDVDGLAENVIKLLDNEDIRIELGKEAKFSFENRASFDMEEQWKEILTDDFSSKDIAYSEEIAVFDSLFDTIDSTLEECYLGSKNYRLGEKLLKIPRKVLGR